jgi:hypothetical protein
MSDRLIDLKRFFTAFVVGIGFWLLAFWPWVEQVVRG